MTEQVSSGFGLAAFDWAIIIVLAIDDLGAEINSKGEDCIRLFFFKNLKNPLADERCL